VEQANLKYRAAEVAGLSLLMVVPFVHGRAVRLTTRRVEDAQPSRAEVLADKDLQRAAFALSMRRLEIKLQEFKDKHACQLAELGRKTDFVNQLRMETDGLRDLLRKAEHITICKTNEARELRRIASQQGSDLVETTDALEAARCHLEEEQTTFANFRDRIAAFMREVAAQINEEKELDLRRQQDLQHRLSAQSRLLSEAEGERNTVEADPQPREARRQDRAAAAAEHQPQRSEEFRGQPLSHRSLPGGGWRAS